MSKIIDIKTGKEAKIQVVKHTPMLTGFRKPRDYTRDWLAEALREFSFEYESALYFNQPHKAEKLLVKYADLIIKEIK